MIFALLAAVAMSRGSDTETTGMLTIFALVEIMLEIIILGALP